MNVSQSGKFQLLFLFSKFLQVESQKPSSAMMRLVLMRTATGKEDPELPLLQRRSSLKSTAPQIADQINASLSSSNRHISTSTVHVHTTSIGPTSQCSRTLANRAICIVSHPPPANPSFTLLLLSVHHICKVTLTISTCTYYLNQPD